MSGGGAVGGQGIYKNFNKKARDKPDQAMGMHSGKTD